MTHSFNDEEFAQYQKDMSELKELRQYKSEVLKRAKKWAEKNAMCKGQHIGDAFCFECAVGDILPHYKGCAITGNFMDYPK